MTDIRIVCTYDALKLAETLMRLLEAEQHRVRLTYGRQALGALEEARNLREAVVLIWSPDARSQTYMLEWVRNTDPLRLCEIARASDWPTIKRKSPVIEFAQWRGERGGRAWNTLNERLRAIGLILNPPKGPSREAVMAVAFGATAAVLGAVAVRLNADDVILTPDPAHADVATIDASVGLGGPLVAVEPASLEDQVLRFHAVGAHMETIDWEPPAAALAPLPDVSTLTLRDQTLFERVSELIPSMPRLRDQDDRQQN